MLEGCPQTTSTHRGMLFQLLLNKRDDLIILYCPRLIRRKDKIMSAEARTFGPEKNLALFA